MKTGPLPAPVNDEPKPLGLKYDTGKLQYGLIDVFAEAWHAAVLTYGAVRYKPENWRLVDNAKQRYLEALIRHIKRYQAGEEFDEDSGLPHLAHAMCNLTFIAALELPRDFHVIESLLSSAIKRELDKR